MMNTREWRFQHGTGPEPRSYTGSSGPAVWSCPDGCGTDLTEADGGMRCGTCGEAFSYARLAAGQ